MHAATIRRPIALACALAVLLLVLAPATALAAWPLARFSSLQAVIHESTEGPVLILSGTIPESVKLPVTVSFPVPHGAEIVWAGEVLGGDLSQDIVARPMITEDTPAIDLATFSVTKSRNVQVEVMVPGATVRQGESTVASVTLTVPSAMPTAAVSLRIPETASVVTMSPGLVREPGPTGFVYLTYTATNVKPGTVLSASAVYTGGTSATGAAAVPTGTAAPGGDSTALIVGVVALAALLAFGALVFARMRSKQAVEVEDEPVSGRAAPAARVAAPVSGPGPDDDVDSPAGTKRTSMGAVMFAVVALLFIAVFAVVVVSSRPAEIPQAQAGVQRFKIDTTKGEFLPNEVRVKANEPVELEFPPGGAGCTGRITFEQLGVDADLSRGGLVKLPALKPGTYAFKGGCGSESGAVIAE
ncbi:MAG: cupredoxin domain-containing protein [Coriobacteriia bacterium]|nr:cupredoxin domain-containing protein [Coriobacteriia bacterium]